MEKKLNPVHPVGLNPVKPGEVLQEEFLKPMGISQNHLALKIGVPARRINEIVVSALDKKRGGSCRITADTALRLAQFFGTTAKFWLGLQTDYDLDVTTDELGDRIEREVSSYNLAG